MFPDEYCLQKAAASGSSFYYSFLFLPQEQRRAISALYAFCREVDDVVDECSEPQLARVKLQWWKQEIDNAFTGRPQHPVTRALQPAIAAHGLPIEYFRDIIDGMHMDLDRVRYENFEQLSLYCYRVAGSVGLLSTTIFGFHDTGTAAYARDLGTALQLTNIIRDLREDAVRGRVYIPEDELRQHGVRQQDILDLRDSPGLRSALAQQAQRANEYYDRALTELPDSDRLRQRGGVIMARIYRETLAAIEQDNFQVLAHHVSLTPLRKLWIAWRTSRKESRRARRLEKSAAC